jgi:putative two-component system response regulator
VGGSNAIKGDDAAALIKRTDSALYTSKQHGRNRTSIHNGNTCEPIHFEESQIESVNPGLGFGKGDHHEIAENVRQSKIFVVDDEPTISLMVRKLLKNAGYENVIIENDSTLAFDRILEERPDMILLDIRMPNVDGLEILRMVRSNEMVGRLPIVFLTSTSDSETKIKALNNGATDFLPKPVNGSELVARVKNTLLAKQHVDVLADYSNKLEHEVRLRTAELSASRREAIQCLARAAEIRDDQTGQHVFRVGRYAAIIAKEIGFSAPLISTLEYAAQLHDVGKIGIPDDILKKPAKLTEDEFEIMKSHCSVGNQIIGRKVIDDSENIKSHASLGESIFEDCNSPIMRMAATVAASHHEKWDGSGYPRGLVGEEIPIEGRITAVADVFDAVSSARPYKTPFPIEKCFAIIEEGSGTHFEPKIVEAFLARKQEVFEIYTNYGDKPSEDGTFESVR